MFAAGLRGEAGAGTIRLRTAAAVLRMIIIIPPSRGRADVAKNRKPINENGGIVVVRVHYIIGVLYIPL